jgi:sodium/bile acid cotransporter 7
VALQNSQPKTPARAASPTLGDWGLMFCGALAIHLGMLLAAVWGGRLLGLPRPDRIAAGFSGSQKTLLVGLDIASEYVEVFGPLALLPMVAYHVLQLLVDTVIADRMAREA